MSKFRLEFDGVSRGNPGHAGGAAALYEISRNYRECVWFDSDYFGNKKTNNQSEYMALIIGLEECAERQVPNLQICGDSQLVIRHLTGEYKVKHKKLIPLHRKAVELIALLPCTPTYKWIPREENTTCDTIANQVVDRELGLDEQFDEEEYDNDMIEREGNFGYSSEYLNEMMCNGIKPWEC
jgi:ribonuclease HI